MGIIANKMAVELYTKIKNKIKAKKEKKIYRHYKGGRYELLYIAKHSETLEEMAVYKALYGDGDIWVRPYSMWNEEVLIDGKSVPRFKEETE